MSQIKSLTQVDYTPSKWSGGRGATLATAIVMGLIGTSALSQTCSVSPDYVNWVTPGTITGGFISNLDQSATLEWGSASSDITISGPGFVVGTETSIIRITEYAEGRGTYTVDFASPVIHDVKLFVGNAGRTTFDQLGSGIFGDFNYGLSSGAIAANLFGSVSPLDNSGYFAIFDSDTQGISQTTLVGPGPDGLPLDGRFWVHDGDLVVGDINNGGQDQAYGMVDLDYLAPATISPTSETISDLTFRQVGIGVGPTMAFGIQARIRSCIEALDDDFSTTPISSGTGGTTASVLTDDNLNTLPVDTTPVLGNVDLAVVTPATPAAGSITLDSNTGQFTIAPNTTPGTYFVTYSLTDRPTGGVATNTDTAIATVVVEPDFTPIIAEDDDFASSPLDGVVGGLSGDAFANDTIGLVPVDAANVTATVITAATPNNPGDAVPFLETAGVNEGRVTVPAPTPAGIYTITYEICEDAAPGNCDQAQINVGVLNGIGVDYGDAPISYGAPIHNVTTAPTIYMGAVAPDTEAAPASGIGAAGDDSANQDDEDGVVLPILTQGVNTTLSVDVIGSGYLQAWLDYNGDGTFETPLGEQIATDLQDDGTGDDVTAGDGIIQFVVMVPVDATTSLTYARFRYSSQPGLLFSDFAPDGEVEDYSLLIAAADLVDRGDAPASYGDPRHAVVPSIYLGAGVPDSDVIPIHSADADADDLTAADDEDGVAAFPIFNAGSTASLTVATHETLSDANALLPPLLRSPGITNLQVWIDFNGDGAFSTDEQVAINYRDGGTGDTDGVFNDSITLDVPIPANAINGDTFARLRWSTSSALASDPFDGFNADGEVEDYKVTIINASPPLTCDSSFYMVANESGSDLPLLTRLSATFDGTNYNLSQTPLPPNYTGNYLVTGWGYNELDGYIYGVRQSPRSLMRMDGSGAVTEVADLSTYAIESPDTTTDILPNGVLIYKSGSTNSLYQLLDISDPTNPVDLGVLDAGAGAPYGRDMAYNPVDGLLYFFDPARNLYSMDPLGGVPGTTTVNLVQAEVPLAAGFSVMDIDSVWFDQQGYIYGFDNQSRQVFAMEIGTDGNRPASYDFIEIEGTVSNITYQGNDGASCRGPGPFAPVSPQGSISGNAYLDQDGSDTRDAGESNLGAGIAITLYDDNGTAADLTDDTLLAATDTLADGTYSFTELATGTYRVELDTADPEIPSTAVIGTSNPILGVTVVDGSDTSAQDFGFDPADADLSITKSALSAATGLTITSAQPDDAIDFVVSVSNAGPGSPTGVQVSDLLPDGYSYVSDDAVANGDTYDATTGIWVLDQVLSGTTETLTIRVTMRDSGNTTNTAEIFASSLPDPDSDPGVGPVTDDLTDGVADDDEASATVVRDNGGRLLAGRVFVDNGIGGGTAHDGLVDGAEIGSQSAIVSILDASGALLTTPLIAADGSWSYELSANYNGAITVQVQPLAGSLVVSEVTTSLPSLVNSDPYDGVYSFTPDANSTYVGLDFGIVQAPTLSQDREASIEGGQAVTLQHEYKASTDGTVNFSYANETKSPANSFSVTLYRDADCDGSPESTIIDPIAVSAGDRLCLISRVTANSGLGSGSSYSYDLIASTSLTATTIISTSQNTDRIVASDSAGRLELSKTVRNLTQNTPEGASNGGTIGDVLQYRIYLTNPSSSIATNVMIYDQTPAYTVLAGPIPNSVVLGPDLTCVVAEPASNVAGYSGALRWNCTGSYLPGETGFVSFDVTISP